MSNFRALIYDPYLGTLGGGERYAFALAEVIGVDFDVIVAGDRVPSRSELADRGLTGSLEIQKMSDRVFSRVSRDFDLAIVIANFLPPRSFANRSILVIQFPFPWSVFRHPKRAMIRTSLLSRYEPLVYSSYVADWCRQRWRIDPTVLSPPAVCGSYHVQTKKQLILSVGRFFHGSHSKRQDVLIEAFRQLPWAIRQRFTLVCAGGAASDRASKRYIASLMERCQGEHIELEINVSDSRLRQLYSEAMLFWHATGYGRSGRHPERAEHFGISVVEAMSYGAVPLVFDDGGPSEIVTSAYGVRWHDLTELTDMTVKLIQDVNHLNDMALKAEARARAYSIDVFQQRARSILFRDCI